MSATAWHKVRSVVPDNYSASSIWKHLASISAIKHVVKWRKSPFERPLNKKKIRNDVTTGNASEVAAITLFLFLCCDNNLGKRDYNPDKQQKPIRTAPFFAILLKVIRKHPAGVRKPRATECTRRCRPRSKCRCSRPPSLAGCTSRP